MDYMMNKTYMSAYYPSLPMKLIHSIIGISKVLIKNTSTVHIQLSGIFCACFDC